MNSDQARRRAEESFRVETQCSQKPMTDYEARALVVRKNTERLKALRLAKQAETLKSKR